MASSTQSSNPEPPELRRKIARLEMENDINRHVIIALEQQLEKGNGDMVHYGQRIAALDSQSKEIERKYKHDVVDSQVLITALKKRLKTEQDEKTELKQAIVDLEKLRRADEAEIMKLRNRFNERRVAAEIVELEQQVAALKLEKKLRDKNRMLALQRQIQKYHNSSDHHK